MGPPRSYYLRLLLEAHGYLPVIHEHVIRRQDLLLGISALRTSQTIRKEHSWCKRVDVSPNKVGSAIIASTRDPWVDLMVVDHLCTDDHERTGHEDVVGPHVRRWVSRASSQAVLKRRNASLD